MIRNVLNLTSYAYTPFLWPPLLVGAFLVLIGIIVVIRERTSRISIAFLFTTWSCALWLLANAVVYAATNPSVALWWSRVENLGVVFIPSTAYLFALEIVNKYRRYRLVAWSCLVLSGLFFAMIVLTPWFVSGVQHYPWGNYHRYGLLSLPFLVFFTSLMLINLRLYWRAYQESFPGAKKQRLRALFFAFLIGYLGSIDFLPCFGVPVYPIGFLFVLIFILVAARGVWYYHLTDITAALAAPEIINTMPGILMVLDPRGIICIANRIACEFLGKKEKALIGTSITAHTTTRLKRDVLDQFLNEGSIRDYEIQWSHPTLGLRTLSVAATVMKDAVQQPLAYVCMARDISEGRRMEAALHQSESKFRRLLDSNIIGFMLVDFAGNILETNEAFLKLLGYTREDFAAGGVGGTQMTPHEYRFVDQWMLERIKQTGFCSPVEKEYIRKDGSRISVLVGVVLLEEVHHQCLCFVIDATERRWAIEQMQKAYDELEHRVNERTSDLSQANVQLQKEIEMRQMIEQRLVKTLTDLSRSNRELEEFAYIVSHDLQEPLRKITSYTDLLMQRYKAQMGADADKFIHYIVDGTLRMQQLISDLLAYSRMSRGTFTVNRLDLQEVLQEVLNNLETSIQESQAVITYDTLPKLLANRSQMIQLLQNLISNALKFRSHQTPQIHLGATHTGNEWTIFIKDNGIGIDPKYSDRIFIIFQRLHTREEYPGTGIGLAICKKVVERHGGRIWVESQPGQGTTFYFTLPEEIPSLNEQFDEQAGAEVRVITQ